MGQLQSDLQKNEYQEYQELPQHPPQPQSQPTQPSSKQNNRIQKVKNTVSELQALTEKTISDRDNDIQNYYAILGPVYCEENKDLVDEAIDFIIEEAFEKAKEGKSFVKLVLNDYHTLPGFNMIQKIANDCTYGVYGVNASTKSILLYKQWVIKNIDYLVSKIAEAHGFSTNKSLYCQRYDFYICGNLRHPNGVAYDYDDDKDKCSIMVWWRLYERE